MGLGLLKSHRLRRWLFSNAVEHGYLRDVLGWNKDFIERTIPYHGIFISKLAKEKAAAEKERTETKMVLEAGVKLADLPDGHRTSNDL